MFLAALRLCARYLQSWIGLAELYMSQGRWAEFEEALAWLEGDGRAGADTAILRARALSLSPRGE
jgi:hypothetical protein